MYEEKLAELKTRLLEIDDLEMAGSVLHWDQTAYMPPGGAVARARQSATLARLFQEKFIDPAVGKLLDNLQAYGESLPYDSDEAALIRVTRRKYENAVKIPPNFLAKVYSHLADTYQLWTTARPANDFASIQTALEQTVDYSRRFSEYMGKSEHIADPLIDMADEGMRAESIQKLFAELRLRLVPLLKAIKDRPLADDSCLRKTYPEADQLAFSLEVIRRLGFDFHRGRMDQTPHPFMTRFSLGDIRILTRVKENDLGDCLFSAIHEAGHGMYELGICIDYEGTPLAVGTSAGVHESQSRLWENVVGRSRGFWEYFYPELQAAFPGQLKDVTCDTFYRAVNKVQPSLIRTDADEVTYNLHVMLRFDLELALLDGRLAVRDLPEAWAERYETDLGIQPPDHRDGVLQDVHWFGGLVGGDFQGYTLGNIMSAQFFASALKANPSIPEEIRQGHFSTLHTWLVDNIYQHGKKFTADELIERVTGGPLTITPYIEYLTKKYGELYAL
jgi:carboxypeptidase Taq